MSKKRNHKKKCKAKKMGVWNSMKEPRFLIWDHTVFAAMPDASVKALMGPSEGFDFGQIYTRQNDFCQLPGGKILFRMPSPYS